MDAKASSKRGFLAGCLETAFFGSGGVIALAASSLSYVGRLRRPRNELARRFKDLPSTRKSSVASALLSIKT
jgi:hypothetical protein